MSPTTCQTEHDRDGERVARPRSKSMPAPGQVQRSLRALGTTAVLAVTVPEVADRAERILRDELAAIDRACSRFRSDSEISEVHRAQGRIVPISALLCQALEVACDVARETAGAVDPTVGSALEGLGYDRDFELIRDKDSAHFPGPLACRGSDRGDAALRATAGQVPGWWRIELDTRRRTLRVPPGTCLDLGATAKALVTDRAAQRIASSLATGVVVSVGGDVAIAGPAPQDGWPVGIAVDSSCAVGQVDEVVAIRSGGLASSSTLVRTWRRGTRRLHHIVDPASGACAAPFWTLVSVAAPTCVAANASSTAAIVWGPAAPPRLAALGRPARLVRVDGGVVRLNGWPAPRGASAGDGPKEER